MSIILSLLVGFFVATTVILAYIVYNCQNKIDIYEGWIVEFKNDVNDVYLHIKDIDGKQIFEKVQVTQAKIVGPIPLPVKKKIYCVLRSPHVNKDSREHFEIRKHSRIIDIYPLYFKQISEYCIKKALATITTTDYLQTAQKLFDAKRNLLKSEKNIFIKKRKLQDYLMQKGYEISVIKELMD